MIAKQLTSVFHSCTVMCIEVMAFSSSVVTLPFFDDSVGWKKARKQIAKKQESQRYRIGETLFTALLRKCRDLLCSLPRAIMLQVQYVFLRFFVSMYHQVLRYGLLYSPMVHIRGRTFTASAPLPNFWPPLGINAIYIRRPCCPSRQYYIFR